MAAIFPSQYNTFIPSTEGSRRLLVDFSRNPRDFALNQYVTIVPDVPEMIGYYTKMTVEERMRILSTSDDEHNWADGSDSPPGNESLESHNFVSFTCARKAFVARIGNMAAQQAGWDMFGQYAAIKAQQAMTSRTQAVITAATTTSNYAAGNTSSTTTAGGGQFSAATTANPYIKKSIDYAITAILKATGGVVKADDLNLVINPNLAKTMAESQELLDYLKGSPSALAYVRGETSDGPQKNRLYGLPATYAGVNLVVEDAVKVTSKKAATLASSFVLGDATPFIAARPGGLVAAGYSPGTPSFSTLTLFVYRSDDLSVETMNDTDNRVTKVRVVDTRAAAVTADISGYAFTGAM